MALTREMANSLAAAVRAQMERCPGCHGIGQVRQSGDYQPCFCLVCEDVAKALYICGREDAQGVARFDDPRVRERLEPIYERLAAAAQEFVKRCPGCFGVGKVWSAAQQRPCLVCADLRRVLADYHTEAAPLEGAEPHVFVKRKGRHL